MTSLATWVSRGRPTLPIDSFYAAVSPSPVAPDAHRTKPTKGTLTPEDPAPNSWLPLIQSTLEHPDDHLCKLQRSLVHFAALYGTREAGYFSCGRA
ncbi:hypothetical protein A0H81_07065 [Grifola frondosa]|uniref:Uncharacterized protein n=1 Tax=Grifola frondosa TaxID=5627 RepID=A0A1C7M900_GRIFR|nr:hypothetical protein A0H81_07065 [Grifola frondosa]